MAGIRISGGKPYQYITEDPINGTLFLDPPNSLIVTSIEFKLDTNNAIILNSTSANLGFFNGATVPQQAAPVTLADVISVLQSIGLTQ